MRADHDFYLGRLYPMQDRILARLASIETGFYLTGGTAASRAYLHHRFSDDLDFFVNDDDRFGLWAQRVVQALARSADWRVRAVARPDTTVDIHGVHELSFRLTGFHQ